MLVAPSVQSSDRTVRIFSPIKIVSLVFNSPGPVKLVLAFFCGIDSPHVNMLLIDL